MGFVDIAVFVIFVISVIGVGLWKSKSAHSEEGSAADYFLAGRGLTWWLIGVSLIAANISAEQFVGMSGSAASHLGLAIASYEWMAAVTLVVVAFAFLPYFLKTGIYTIPGFLEQRYNHVARSIMAVFMMVILVTVSLAGVIYAGALPMNELLATFGFKIGMTQCCWLMGLFAAAYVAAGGLKACAWADLIQGTALIVGGAIISYLAFRALGVSPSQDLVNGSGVAAAVSDGTCGVSKFFSLNGDKLHMFMPKTDKVLPWTALLIGLWIPNFYYWGLNQYITQRILGSASLAEGQKGIVFAASLKLIIPFIIVFPGLIAFNLYSKEMAERGANDPAIKIANAKVIEHYQAVKNDAAVFEVFAFDKGWAQSNVALAAELTAYNAAEQAAAAAAGKKVVTSSLTGYKYDSALGLLIVKLIKPGNGVLGFVLAALLGAIVSSLAAVLNAASTIFSIDIYHSYINKKASPKQLVAVGRICVGVFVVIGCVLAPMLANPNLGGIFTYIQMFQGFISPGVLAVFVFGLLNRTANGWVGVIGLLLNPVLYGVLNLAGKWTGVEIDFLNAMAVCLVVNLAVMFVLGHFMRLPQPVVFQTNTHLSLATSQGAKWAGIGVVVATAILYVIFR
ncbi:MAG TPA: sodium/solute symporter [Kiritimatiellia bacterium]|nr:sodium/solute symporter [Kiritimatiellia bacterium]HPS07860.1 sodium/solute symporter [Kiritimatiellia bacterium]